jgi:hypothetical protein
VQVGLLWGERDRAPGDRQGFLRALPSLQ